MIQGSSWTVGAYQKSSTVNSDELVPGGIAELLTNYRVTNISVKDDFNLGCSLRIREHLKNNHYDKILICQNDPLRDMGILRSTDTAWSLNFDFDQQQLLDHEINTITKLIDFLLDKFYRELSMTGIPTYVFAGPSCVNKPLAVMHGLHVIEPSWTEALIPSFKPSYIEGGIDFSAEILLKLFPENSRLIKQEFIQYCDDVSRMLETWQSYPEYFAYHHPTVLGNRIFYEQCLQHL